MAARPPGVGKQRAVAPIRLDQDRAAEIQISDLTRPRWYLFASVRRGAAAAIADCPCHPVVGGDRIIMLRGAHIEAQDQSELTCRGEGGGGMRRTNLQRQRKKEGTCVDHKGKEQVQNQEKG